MGIFSQAQLNRMKHVELVCELMLSLISEDVLNKKTALDRVMAAQSLSGKSLEKAISIVTKTLNRIKQMFPHLKATRLRQITDFYSLAVLIGRFEQQNHILTDRRRNRIAWGLLAAFASKVDEVRELQRKAQGAKPGYELYRDYLLTVSQMTDDVNQRRKRESILRSIIESIFAKKDSQRGFTSEQRRIIWNNTSDRRCIDCGDKLIWDNFTLDHIDPHSKGGKSRLENATLMCQKCNSSKGNRKNKIQKLL
jgi:hypothetical protein